MARRGDNLTQLDYANLKRFVQVVLLDYVPMPRTIDAAREAVEVTRLYIEGDRLGTVWASPPVPPVHIPAKENLMAPVPDFSVVQNQPPVYDPSNEPEGGPVFYDIASKCFVDIDNNVVMTKREALTAANWPSVVIRLRRRRADETMPDIKPGVAHLLDDPPGGEGKTDPARPADPVKPTNPDNPLSSRRYSDAPGQGGSPAVDLDFNDPTF